MRYINNTLYFTLQQSISPVALAFRLLITE